MKCENKNCNKSVTFPEDYCGECSYGLEEKWEADREMRQDWERDRREFVMEAHGDD